MSTTAVATSDIEVIKYPSLAQLAYFETVLTPETYVVIQEKLDGSNVGIRRVDGELVLQSRTTIIDQSAPGMFFPFVKWAQSHEPLNDLAEGWVLYGEFVNNHQRLKYDATAPFVLFDTYLEGYNFLRHRDLETVAASFDLPSVPVLYAGAWQDVTADLRDVVAGMTDKQEGLVVKTYDITIPWSDPETGDSGTNFRELAGGKLVRDAFKETKIPPTTVKAGGERALEQIADMVVTPARVRKATCGAAEAGDDMSKVHLVIARVARDAHDEDVEAVKNLLFKAYWPRIHRYLATRVLELHPAALAAIQGHDDA